MHPPTASQRAAVSETSRHLLVAAGAGTGKTHTVVWKVLYLLGAEVHGQRIERPLRLHDIAAITYTNQAAKDLKEALRRGLRAVGRRDDAFDVDLARIGTIHSFCADLLRDHALRAGRSITSCTIWPRAISSSTRRGGASHAAPGSPTPRARSRGLHRIREDAGGRAERAAVRASATRLDDASRPLVKRCSRGAKN